MKTSTNDFLLHRPTWAEVNLDALQSNLLKIKGSAPHARVLAVLKSDAYGHGATVIGRELEQLGVAFIGVATPGEAMFLRKGGIRGPILLMGGLTREQFPVLLDYNMTPIVYNAEIYRALAEFARGTGKPIRIHIKVDTGMHRLGFSPEDAASVVALEDPWIEIEGVCTHLANADLVDDAYTIRQLRDFEDWVSNIGRKFEYIHSANSSAVLNYPESHYNLIRPGLLLYGIDPRSPESTFEPILTLKSKIIHLHWIRKGETIGYGRTFEAPEDSLIATLPIGYSDGLRRALSGRLQVEVCDQLCPVAGTISMDLCMVDVTAVADRVKLDEIVTVLGPRNSAWHWAQLLNTIPYEITCLLGNRVARVYYRQGNLIDIYYP